MGDNYISLRKEFCEWLLKQADKSDSDIKSEELQNLTEQEMVSQNAKLFQAFLKLNLLGLFQVQML